MLFDSPIVFVRLTRQGSRRNSSETGRPPLVGIRPRAGRANNDDRIRQRDAKLRPQGRGRPFDPDRPVRRVVRAAGAQRRGQDDDDQNARRAVAADGRRGPGVRARRRDRRPPAPPTRSATFPRSPSSTTSSPAWSSSNSSAKCAASSRPDHRRAHPPRVPVLRSRRFRRRPDRNLFARHEATAGLRLGPVARSARAGDRRADGRARSAQRSGGQGPLRDRAAAGTTVFMSTHTLDVAEEIASRIGIMDHGRLHFLGTVGELQGELAAHDASLERLFLELTSGNGKRERAEERKAEGMRGGDR